MGRPADILGDLSGLSRLLPVTPLDCDPPTVESLTEWSRLIEDHEGEPTPGDIAQGDQVRQYEADLNRAVLQGDHDGRLESSEIPDGEQARIGRLALGMTIQRKTTRVCRHVEWPLHPYHPGEPVVALLASGAATCRHAECLRLGLTLLRDDHRCDVCDTESDVFQPLIMACGRVVASLDVCEDCADNIFGGRPS